MALFMLDCDSVTSTGSTLDSVAKEITNIGSSVNGYDTSCEDGFDFASAKSAIASNIEACSVKVQNASKIVSTVVSSHTSLQNQLIYGKKEEEKKTQQRKTSGGGTSSGGGGGYYSGGGGGGSYSGGGGSYTGATTVGTTQSALSDLTSDELEELRKILDGEKSVEVKTEVKKITCKPIDKEKLTDEEKEILENENLVYNTDGYAMIGNRYVISCDKSFGKVGDAITFMREDGTSIDCVIGKVTEDEASKNTVNFFVDPDKWKASNENNITIDLTKDIKKITNSGKAKLPEKDAKTETKTDTTTDTTTDTKTDTSTNTETTTDTTTDTTTTTDTSSDRTRHVNPLKTIIDKEREKNNNDTGILASMFNKNDDKGSNA